MSLEDGHTDRCLILLELLEPIDACFDVTMLCLEGLAPKKTGVT